MIIVDLELNQPSRKIIQIGSVKVCHKSDSILPLYSTYVNPKEPLDGYIQGMCGIRNHHIKGAPEIEEAMVTLWDHILSVGSLGAWGDDCRWLYNLAKTLGINVPSDFPMYDLSRLCNFLDIEDRVKTRKGTSLKKTLALYNLPFEGKHHNAHDDAVMTAKLYLVLRRKMKVALGLNHVEDGG